MEDLFDSLDDEKPAAANTDTQTKLLNNAFCFLKTAIAEFKEKPKYSVVHFCTAIELLLKARLLHEHWSLIVDGKPDRKKFFAGDFKSLSFSALMPTIENVLGERLPDKAKASFEKLANHRNKMMHFFHDAEESTSQKNLEVIAIEQSLCWYFLSSLLSDWHQIFGDHKKTIQMIDYQMKRHGVYLDAVLDTIKSEIETDEQEGITYHDCKFCKRKAAKLSSLTDDIFECQCRLCSMSHWLLRIQCPSCEAHNIEIDDNVDAGLECECGEHITKEDIIDVLDTEPVTTDNYHDHVPINCARCSGYHSVIHHHDRLICMDCIEVFSEDEWGICGWCNEGQAGGGDMEFSYHSGCEFCDGRAGWERDD